MATVTVTAAELRALIAEAVRAQTEPLALQVHQLAAVLDSKVAAPTTCLTVAQSAKYLGRSVSTVERLLARRVFTDCRASKTNGSPWLIYQDELDALKDGGEELLKRHRKFKGRL